VNVAAHAEQVVAEPEQAVHEGSHDEHRLPFKYVPTAQPHVDPSSMNAGSQAEQFVAEPEQIVHFESHEEQ
jgi:hypothetical protein